MNYVAMYYNSEACAAISPSMCPLGEGKVPYTPTRSVEHTAKRIFAKTKNYTATHCNTLQHTATHCNTLQHSATHCNTLQHTATHYNTPQHTATYCNTLHYTAIHCHTYFCEN